MTTAPTAVTAVPRLPRRQTDTHKGDYGRVLVVAGSRGLSGAAVLTGSGALRSGAGLVRVACPADIQPVVAAGNPCYLTAPISLHADGTYGQAALDELVALSAWADVLAVGPGLGNRPDVAALVRSLLIAVPDRPVVLDADGLNVLPSDPEFELTRRPGPVVLTPHPGEFARMTGKSIAEVQADRESLAVSYASAVRAVVLLKGHGTLVTDGQRLYRNPTGNPGMATGGTGDVLTGLIAALIGQGLAAFDAAVLGAWTHGRAADLGVAHLSQVALTATDLLDYLPVVFREQETD